MSRRKIQQDAGVERAKAYKSMDQNKAQEAIWEAFEALTNSGISVGVKAEQILNERNNIKQQLPK